MRHLFPSLVVALICPVSAAAASDLTVAEAGYEYAAPAALTGPSAGLEDTMFTFSTAYASVKVPLTLGNAGTHLLPGFQYRGLFPRQSRGTDADGPAGFHEMSLSLTLAQKLDDTWRLAASITPGIATNFQSFDADHFRINAAAIAEVTLMPRLVLHFGLIVSYTFGELLPLPALGLDWRPVPLFRLDVSLPDHIHAVLAPWEGWEFGAKTQLTGNRFIIRNSAAPNGADTVRHAMLDVGADVAVRLFGPLWLRAYGGYSVMRIFEVLDASGDTLADLDLKPAPVVRVSLELRPEKRQDQ